jgi:hypothetical protein
MRRWTFAFLGLLALSSSAFADDDALRRSISSKQTMLKRFEGQYQAALSAPEKAAEAEKLKQKMRLIESEIVLLQKKTPDAAAPASIPAEIIAPTEGSRRSFDELKGSEWPWLKPEDKKRFVDTTLGALEKNGITVLGDPAHYLEKVGRILEEEPSFENEYLADLVVFCVYDEEPQTREAIHKLRDASTLP